MSTKLIEDLGKGQFRETPMSAPLFVNDAFREADVGPFRQDNVVASQTDADLTLTGVDANAPLGAIARGPGKIVGLTARVNAAIAAETLTAVATIGGANAAGTTAVLSASAQQVVKRFASPVPFVAGDLLGIAITTTAGYLPVTLELQANLIVRYDAAE
jgi:hypothetical protein